MASCRRDRSDARQGNLREGKRSGAWGEGRGKKRGGSEQRDDGGKRKENPRLDRR